MPLFQKSASPPADFSSPGLPFPGRFLFPGRPRPPGNPHTPQKFLAPMQQAPKDLRGDRRRVFLFVPFRFSPPPQAPATFLFPFSFPFLVSRLLFPFLFSLLPPTFSSFSPRAPAARPAPKKKKRKSRLSPYSHFSRSFIALLRVEPGPPPKRKFPPAFPGRFLFPSRKPPKEKAAALPFRENRPFSPSKTTCRGCRFRYATAPRPFLLLTW